MISRSITQLLGGTLLIHCLVACTGSPEIDGEEVISDKSTQTTEVVADSPVKPEKKPVEVKPAFDEQSQPPTLEKLRESMTHRKTPQGWSLIFDNDFYGRNSADLSNSSHIQRLAAFLKHHPQQLVRIEGYSEGKGDYDFNLGLSQRVAEEIRFALVRQGVPSNRIIAKGLGKGGIGNLAQGTKQSRRVEVIILDQGQIP